MLPNLAAALKSRREFVDSAGENFTGMGTGTGKSVASSAAETGKAFASHYVRCCLPYFSLNVYFRIPIINIIIHAAYRTYGY